MQDNSDERFTAAAAAEIKLLAKRLKGHYGYRASDIEDLEQELAAHVIQRMDQYVPERGSRGAFVSTVAKNRILNLIEARTAAKRDGRRNVSLDPAGVPINTSQEGIDLKLDVRAALADLPDDLRQVALLRMEHTEREIEALLGLTRAQVRWRMRQLEQALRSAGLAPDYSDS